MACSMTSITDPAELGLLIRRERTAQGILQEDLALAAGTGPPLRGRARARQADRAPGRGARGAADARARRQRGRASACARTADELERADRRPAASRWLDEQQLADRDRRAAAHAAGARPTRRPRSPTIRDDWRSSSRASASGCPRAARRARMCSRPRSRASTTWSPTRRTASRWRARWGCRRRAPAAPARAGATSCSSSAPRSPQQDFCQALGVPAKRRYEASGGPSAADCFALVRANVPAPARDILALVDLLAFNLLVGNHDASAKSLSLLTTPAGPRLAPLRDLVSTAVYPAAEREAVTAARRQAAAGEGAPAPARALRRGGRPRPVRGATARARPDRARSRCRAAACATSSPPTASTRPCWDGSAPCSVSAASGSRRS